MYPSKERDELYDFSSPAFITLYVFKTVLEQIGNLLSIPYSSQPRGSLRKIFIIDIDGCICEHVDNENPELMRTARPYPDSIRKINEWYDQGHYVCFFTARTEHHRQDTVDWLREHGVKFHQLVLGKPRRNEGDEYHYIDDTPIRATRYRGVFGDLVKRTKEVFVFDED